MTEEQLSKEFKVENMYALSIHDASVSEPVITITPKGKLVINPKYTLEEAEELFWNFIADKIRVMYESYLPQVLTNND